MTDNDFLIALPLFVPCDRSDRFAKAVAAGPDAVIFDLEDAVAPASKAAARAGLAQAVTLIAPQMPVAVRINAVAAMKGLIAASLAAKGFLGAADAIEGTHGFLLGYSDNADRALAVHQLGQVRETLRIGVKPYPACRYTHAAVDGLLRLRRDLRLAPAEVDSVIVGLHRNGITLVGTPLPEKRRVRSIVEGQFSMPFAASVALLRGGFDFDDYDLLGRAEVDALSDRIDLRRDESLEGLRHPFGATLTVSARGQSHTLRIPDPSGERETFPTAAVTAAKFQTLAGPVLNKGADALLDRLQNLPHAPSLRDWFV